MILTTLNLAGAKNTNSWRARNGDLHRAFPLDILVVPSSALTVAANGELLSCGGFSLSKTIHFGSLEFIAHHFGGLSLSPLGDGSGIVVMGPAHGGPPLTSQTMVGDSTEGFPMAPNGEWRTDLPSPRRHVMEAPPASTTTILWPENPPTDQATTTILPRQETPQSDANPPLK
jgi:hypothetical protein